MIKYGEATCTPTQLAKLLVVETLEDLRWRVENRGVNNEGNDITVSTDREEDLCARAIEKEIAMAIKRSGVFKVVDHLFDHHGLMEREDYHV